MDITLSACVPENLVSRDGFGSPVPRQPARLHTQAESAHTHGIPPDFRGGTYLFKPPYDIGSIQSLSGHANAYRWRSPPRVRRHRASSPKVVPVTGAAFLHVTMDQLMCASLFPHPAVPHALPWLPPGRSGPKPWKWGDYDGKKSTCCDQLAAYSMS